MERPSQLNNILNLRINDPPGLNKCDPKKAWYYETIEITFLDKVKEFLKKPKKSYDIGNSNFNQLHFLKNHLMFSFTQFKFDGNFKDQDEYKKLKVCFHALHGKSGEELCSLVKILKVLLVVPDVLFEGLMHNFHYNVVRANSVVFEFTISNFTLKNLKDLIIISMILCDVDSSQLPEESWNSFIIGYDHIKAFIDCYCSYLAKTDTVLAMAIKKHKMLQELY